MKSLRFVLSVVLMSLATVALAQSDAHKMAEPKAPAPKSEAQTSFDAMKPLAGDWEGPVKTDMPVEAKVDIKPLHVSMRVTSRGNVLVHEFQEAERRWTPQNTTIPSRCCTSTLTQTGLRWSIIATRGTGRA